MLVIEIVFGATVALQKSKHDGERDTEVRVRRQVVLIVALHSIARTLSRQSVSLC